MKKIYLLAIVILVIGMVFVLYPGQDKLIIVTGTETPPFEYYDESGELVGIDIDFIEKIFEKLDVAYEIRLTEWDNAIDLMKNGEADIILEAGYTKEREDFISYRDEHKNFKTINDIPEDTLWISGDVLIKNKDSDIYFSLDTLEKNQNRLGIVAGYYYFDKLWDKGLNFYSYRTATDLINGLNKGEMEIILLDKFEAISLMDSLDISSDKFQYSDPLNINGNFILFSKKYEKGKNSKMKDAFYEELIKLKDEGYHEESWLKHTGKTFSETYKEFFE